MEQMETQWLSTSPKGASRWVLDQSAQSGGCNGHYFCFSQLAELLCSPSLAPYMTQVSGDQDSPGAGQTQLCFLPQDCLLTSKAAYRQIAGRKHKTK